MSELPDPDPELAELYGLERDYAAPSGRVKANVWRAVRASIAMPPPPSSDGGGGPAPSLGDRGATSAAAGASGARAAQLALTGVIALVLGAAGGFGAHALLVVPPAPQRVEVRVEVPIEVPVPAPAVAASATEHPALDTPILRDRPATETSAVSPVRESVPPRASELAAERALIDAVRTGIARGDATSALTAIARHEREYSRGRLVEEREGLRVIALLRANRRADAQREAQRFARRYSDSVLRDAIDTALQQ